MPAFKVLILLLLINSAPPMIAFFFPGIVRRPVDCGFRFFDGYPFLGKHKTVAGFLSGILAGCIFGFVMGFPLIIGFLAGLLSMTGDSFTSFIKRRLNIGSGIDIFLLDQFFEGLFPILLIQRFYSFSWNQTLLLLLLFIVMAWAGSKLFMRTLTPNKIKPGKTKPDCTVRSRARFREWRACHTALSPFARMLNFESIIYYRWFMKGLFKCAGIYEQGKKNAVQVRLKSIDLLFPELPES
ncbi:MAG: CDP-archaeol synthase, partial [Desulfosarcina sp.]|nr:CDP-archaeol synthase [Desulfobacterales bacterium]